MWSYIQISTTYDDFCTLITFATLVAVFAANCMYRMEPDIKYIYIYIYIYTHTHTQGVPGGMGQTSGECSLC